MYIKQSLGRYRAVLLAMVFLIGAAGASRMNLLTWLALASFFFYFLYPANLYVKGLSDWSNPAVETPPTLPWIIAGWNLPFIGLFLYDDLPGAMKASLLAFLVLGFIYGMRYRLKFVRFFGTIGSLLYVTPAAFAYGLLEAELPPTELLVAGSCWAAGLYVYTSLMPSSDNDHSVVHAVNSTIATAVCVIFYGLSGYIAYRSVGIVPVVVAGGLGLCALVLLAKPKLVRAEWPFRFFAFVNIGGAIALFVWIVSIINPTSLTF